MHIEQRWQDEVKKVNRGLYIEWDGKISRWKLKHKDDRTGLVRDVFTVENEDGTYRDLDMGTVRMLKDTVMWDLVNKYPDPKDLFLAVDRERKYRKARFELDRFNYMQDWKKENRSRIRAALENARRGIFSDNQIK